MYQFASNRASLIVCLHNEGRRIGEARFHRGEWQTDSEELADALLRAAAEVPQYAIHMILHVTLQPEPVAPAEATPPAATDQPRPASRRKRH